MFPVVADDGPVVGVGEAVGVVVGAVAVDAEAIVTTAGGAVDRTFSLV